MKSNRSDETVSEEVDHGIESAVYQRTAFGLQPRLECLCGETFLADSWEEAGADLDAHLEEVKP